MTKRAKRWLFYSAVAVFLLLSGVVILYAQGYKYSFSESKFLRTGAISLNVNRAAKVFLNDELQGNTSFFNSAYSIDRLLPKKYRLTVQEDGYSTWQKTAPVEEGFVVDFPNVLILAEEGEEEQKLFKEVDLLFKEGELFKISSKSMERIPTEVIKNAQGFRLSENENKLSWWTSNELWVLWLADQNYQPFHKKGDKELVTRFSTTIQNAIWFRGEDHLVLELERFDSKTVPTRFIKL